ncbi:geranylgeranyl transferase type-2 subunit alpha-like [Ptychodera flava]|uniref:geranylgeranyl transferase type-2 subunit alpha-like n=1 Tax=Ptychodera flava TaxID=63121 RepID=UPI00396A3293
MHGRIKVKTTAEQQEAKRKEREKKLQLFNGATHKAFKKRTNEEYDNEALEITGQLLTANSDFTTMWNYRKEVLLHYKEEKKPEEMEAIFKKELSFLESCLRQNPKSYGVWHHRCFVMDTMPNPDWSLELTLCNKFLEYDERNFHCWDYRRFVVQRSKVATQDEVEFTNTKISSNFSNFSSWHYRSKLLPILYPDPEKRERVKEDILHKEYELVQNAFFTDPNDQSAWFYHRWLLGRAEQPQDIRCLYVNTKTQQIVISLTNAIHLKKVHAKVIINNSEIQTSWWTPNKKDSFTTVWICEFPVQSLNKTANNSIIVSIEDSDVQRSCTLKEGEVECWSKDSRPETIFSSVLSAETTTVLQDELDSCQQLQELEPENKWCLLTILFLMRALDPMRYEKQTLEYLTTLDKVDSYRLQYYRDLRSKFIIENTISRMSTSDTREINLCNKDLSCLYHTDHMILETAVDVSANQLSALRHCFMLQAVQKLKADDNKINNIGDVINLPMLQELSIQNNCLTTMEDLSALTSCNNLSVLHLQGNPVCEVPDFNGKVKTLLPQLQQLNGNEL